MVRRRLAYVSTIVIALAMGCDDDESKAEESITAEAGADGDHDDDHASDSKDAGDTSKDAGKDTSDAGKPAAVKTFAAITEVSEHRIAEINDLRGLTYAKDGK